MHLENARSLIIRATERMNALYGKAVFDEWVLVRLATGPGAILAYHGPRAESYKQEFLQDIVPLRVELGQKRLGVGDFAFAPMAAGTHFDACMRIGESSYLFCNHTGKAMNEIRQNPRWLEAQKPFAALSAQFQADPLQ